ncbi:MAG TPA: LysR family transcriptional regulator [Polyangiaceae bacterium]|nr:LysR family transcriptional regulator [Polyangiaceae bacterium]
MPVADRLPLDLLSDLEIFLAERHVTRAAKRLGITQSAASQRLAKLRAHFDDPLLVPASDGLVLTERARSLAVPLSRALDGVRRAVGDGEPFVPAESRRRFVLLGGDVLEALGVPGLSKAFEAAPHVTLSAERVDERFVSRLENGTADAAFVPDFLVPPTLRRLALPPQPFVVLARADHPKLGKRLTLERYLEVDHLLIAPRGMPGSIVDQALAKRHLVRRVAATIQHFSSAPFIVAATDYVVTCPKNVAVAMAEYFPVRHYPVPLPLDADKTSMVWHERVHADPSHVWLRGLVAERIARDTRRGAASP